MTMDEKELLRQLSERYPPQEESGQQMPDWMMQGGQPAQMPMGMQLLPARPEEASDEAEAIGEDEVRQANDLLQKYKAGKAALDKRIIENELWFRMGHWKNYQNKMMEGKPKLPAGGCSTALPTSTPMPWTTTRSRTCCRAQRTTRRPPRCCRRSCHGAGAVRLRDGLQRHLVAQAQDRNRREGRVLGPAARGGLGEISIKSINILMLYWEPGVEDVQDSPNLFSLSLANNDQLESQYPQLKGHTGHSLDVAKYVHDDSLDTSDKSVVVDWYYKKALPGGQTVLHYCKYCNGVVLYASENDPAMRDRGFYDHGNYPFVFDPLFREEDSPAGFGTST